MLKDPDTGTKVGPEPGCQVTLDECNPRHRDPQRQSGWSDRIARGSMQQYMYEYR